MANQRRSSRTDEPLPEDKKPISRQRFREFLGLFRFILPYKWSFIFGLVFLLLSTGTNLTFPYFLGRLVDAAVSPVSADALIKDLRQKALLGQVTEADLDAILAANTQDDAVLRENILHLRERLRTGSVISSGDLESLRRSDQADFRIPTEEINATALILGLILALQGLASYLRIWFFAQVSERGMADIRQALYRKMLTLPVYFFEQRRVGELNSRLASDVSQLQDVLSVTLAEFLRQILTLIVGVSILVFVVSGELTLFMLAVFPVIIIAALIFGRFIRRLSKKTQDQLADSNTIVEETLQAIQVVKAFANEWLEAGRYKAALSRAVKTALQAAAFRGLFVSFIFVALFGAIILVIWYGAHMINRGEIAVGELVSFMLYTVFIGGSVAGMGDLYSQVQKALGASERVREILGETSEMDMRESAAAPSAALTGPLTFENLRFTYASRPELEVLQGISLDIPAGSKVALVGHSGAGKSTIASLLLRFYAPTQGRILLGGQPIDEIDLQEWRTRTGVVPQEVVMFGGTIRENIAYGRPGASEEDILAAAQKAHAWEFITKFPEGLETVVGERGVKLSGGQRQRIAIARAILKDPALLILDEATSSLDAESESLVQAALNTLMEGRTTIIIAHRLSTIRQVDSICVLEGGKIVEMGTHEALAAKPDGVYANLLRLQLENA